MLSFYLCFIFVIYVFSYFALSCLSFLLSLRFFGQVSHPPVFFIVPVYCRQLYSGTTDGNESANILKTAAALHSEQAPGWELKVIGLLICLFADTLPLLTPKHPSASTEEAGDLSAQRKMVSYIYRHYPEKLTLDDIAAAGNVCRSKCCAIFRRYMRQTPIAFLNAYRLQISGDLLRRSSDSITEIALACGFHHMSYFSELFSKTYGCTPREYRASYTVPTSAVQEF